MGMFDSVFYRCECGSDVEWQSKQDECYLKVYSPSNVPSRIAHDINGETQRCKCGRKYTIHGAYLPERVAMVVEPMAQENATTEGE